MTWALDEGSEVSVIGVTLNGIGAPVDDGRGSLVGTGLSPVAFEVCEPPELP
jgi:hypothetical protein